MFPEQALDHCLPPDQKRPTRNSRTAQIRRFPEISFASCSGDAGPSTVSRHLLGIVTRLYLISSRVIKYPRHTR